MSLNIKIVSIKLLRFKCIRSTYHMALNHLFHPNIDAIYDDTMHIIRTMYSRMMLSTMIQGIHTVRRYTYVVFLYDDIHNTPTAGRYMYLVWVIGTPYCYYDTYMYSATRDIRLDTRLILRYPFLEHTIHNIHRITRAIHDILIL